MRLPCNRRILRGHPVLTILAGICALTVCLSLGLADRQLVINTSPSVRPGIYIRSAAAPAVGTLVEFRLPSAAVPYIRSRVGIGPAVSDWYLLKPLVAGPGDWVDTTRGELLINGRSVGPMPPATDGSGRPLPAWRRSKRLGPDEFFAFSARVPNSFDSRCFGPVRRSQITAVRRIVLGW